MLIVLYFLIKGFVAPAAMQMLNEVMPHVGACLIIILALGIILASVTGSKTDVAGGMMRGLWGFLGTIARAAWAVVAWVFNTSRTAVARVYNNLGRAGYSVPARLLFCFLMILVTI